MDVCLILFRKKMKPVKPDLERHFLEASWQDSLKVMSDSSFLPKILRYPTDTINAEMIDLAVPYINYQ